MIRELPHDGPVTMPDHLRELIRDAYPTTLQRLSMVSMVAEYLDRLNAEGRYEDARIFLSESEIGIQEDGARRFLEQRKERRRTALRIVCEVAVSALILVFLKAFLVSLGLVA